jgi:nucleotide-binding universal stress UspA family protein
MTLVVPFDNSDLSKTALVRATQFDTVLEDGVLAVSVVPNNAKYARERGWLADDEEFDRETVLSGLREQVRDINPDAAFESISVSRYAQAGEIASKIRKFARNNDASIVFVGSENAGRVVNSVGSVGGSVAADRRFDTMIISTPGPSNIEELEAEVPTDELLESATNG